ncbi:MAG: hypothetical protein V7637_6234 [Mycobacteriales bacterium]|jgi:hypothetical protein
MTMTSPARAQWRVPAALLALAFIPVVAGAARLTQLAGGAEITPDNARFFASPVPVVLHIVGISIYSILGPFQFAGAFRRRRPGWHRAAGRLLVPSGLAVALSGLWMTFAYDMPSNSGLLTAFRLVFGSAMAASIVLGFVAIRRRDFARHRAWMIRGYAIAMGAGTQVFTHLPWLLIVGTPVGDTKAVLMLAGWLINVAVAEWVIRTRLPAPRPAPAAAPLVASPGQR